MEEILTAKEKEEIRDLVENDIQTNTHLTRDDDEYSEYEIELDPDPVLSTGRKVYVMYKVTIYYDEKKDEWWDEGRYYTETYYEENHHEVNEIVVYDEDTEQRLYI